MIDAFASEVQFRHHLEPIMDLVEAGNWEAENPERPVLVASYGDLKKVRHKGYTKIARIEHGAGQNYGTHHGNYAGGRDNDDVGLFLVPNQYSADLWQTSYPRARVEIVGCPKLDTLPRKDTTEPLTVCISFHWDCRLVPETMSAFGHFRRALEPLNAAFNLIGHCHPRAAINPPNLPRHYRRAGIEYVEDFAEVCRRADLYICDNSSSLYEFAATGRPVVVMNAPTYRKDVHHGLRFWDAIPGPQVDDPADLVDIVAQTLQDGQQALRDEALALVYPIRTGAAERAAAILTEWSTA